MLIFHLIIILKWTQQDAGDKEGWRRGVVKELTNANLWGKFARNDEWMMMFIFSEEGCTDIDEDKSNGLLICKYSG